MTKIDGPIFEYACHEGNYGMRNNLSGARAEEKRPRRPGNKFMRTKILLAIAAFCIAAPASGRTIPSPRNSIPPSR
jgi:hypothetical protein